MYDPGVRTRDREPRGEGSVQNPELEVGQLVLLGLVGLIIVQVQGLVLMRETFKHSNVHELVIFNLNLRRESGVRGAGAASEPKSPCLADCVRKAPEPGGRVPSGHQQLGR